MLLTDLEILCNYFNKTYFHKCVKIFVPMNFQLLHNIEWQVVLKTQAPGFTGLTRFCHVFCNTVTSCISQITTAALMVAML
jgi:hypothetical protein